MAICETLLFRFWWVILFALFCGIGYEQGLKKIRNDTAKLQNHMNKLENALQVALEENQELQLQINSQSDPAWIELTLMKGLGVVPEGQKKVFFVE